MSTGAGASDLLHAEDPGLDQMVRGEQQVAARSPMQLFWRRFRRDKVALVALGFIALLILVRDLRRRRSRSWSGPRRRTSSRRRRSTTSDFPRARAASTSSASTRSAATSSRACSTARRCRCSVALIGTGLSVFFGVILGIISGFYRGWADTIIARSLDVMLAFPVLLFGLGIATACSGENGCLGGLIQPGLSVVIAIIVLANTPYVARIIRGQVLSLREKEFVEASRSLGASNARIMFRDILPNLVAPIIVYAIALHPGEHPAGGRALVPGRRRPAARRLLGRDALRRGVDLRHVAWWFMFFPGMALLLTVLAFNLVGDGLQDALNPKSTQSR